MLVRFTDIQISRCYITSGTATNSHEQREHINLFNLNFEPLYITNSNIEQQMLHWAGKEILNGQYKLIACPPGKQARMRKVPVFDNKQPGNSIEILPQFLYYYLYFKKNQITISTKTGQRISKEKLAKAEVPIPSLSIQKNLLPVLKKLLEKNETRIQQIKKAISRIEKEQDLLNSKTFKHLVCFQTGGQVKSAQTKIIRIRNAGTIQAGKTPNGAIKSYFGKEFPLYTQLAFQQGMNIEFAYKHLSDRGLHEAKLIPENSILICFIGAQFGRAGIARKPGACNSQILSFTCNETCLPEYIYYQVISEQFQNQMRHFASNYSISKTDFENLYIELPSLKKQQEIVLMFKKYHERFDKLLAHLNKEMDLINARQFETFSNLLLANSFR
ncbi:MAG: restriction endonuclease subunit S [Bacteroidota bacterium]